MAARVAHRPHGGSARYAATQSGKDLLRSLYGALVLSKAAPAPPQAAILKTLEKLGG
jgi:hypothetical protein